MRQVKLEQKATGRVLNALASATGFNPKCVLMKDGKHMEHFHIIGGVPYRTPNAVRVIMELINDGLLNPNWEYLDNFRSAAGYKVFNVYCLNDRY